MMANICFIRKSKCKFAPEDLAYFLQFKLGLPHKCER